jgi:mRNA interferase RelE/StbE
MASYRIEWKHSAVKELKRLPKEVVVRILKAVEQLAATPYPSGVRKLIGSEHSYRLREGSYRIIYTVSSSALLIEVIRVGHRKDVYNR